MRGAKIALIAAGVIAAWFAVSIVIGLVIDLLIFAAVAAAAVLGVKLYVSSKRVSNRRADSAIGDDDHSQRMRHAVHRYTQSVDDELDRLKRQMGS